MSSRNHPCHRKPPACCPPKKPHCPLKRSPCRDPCQDPCSAPDPCHQDPCSQDPCTSTGGGGCPYAVGGEQGLRNHLSDVLLRQDGGGGKNVQGEVDRLVESARAWSEKEKFKLKQFYEEEMVRKKRALIQEFKCAMERQVVGPLKQKLCDQEKEIHRLKSQGPVCVPGQVQTDSLQNPSTMMNNNKKSAVDLNVVDKALDKARQSNRQLQRVIRGEKSRKTIRTKSMAQGLLQAPLVNVSGEEAPPPTPTNDEDMAELGMEEPQVPDEEEEPLEDIKTTIDNLLDNPEVNEETKAVITKVKELTESFLHAKNFTEEEIQDLIREGELSEQYRLERDKLLEENEELKRKIKKLLKRLQELTPQGGSPEEENMTLRQRIQELEGERTRGSLQTELNLLKNQLEEVWEKNEIEKDPTSTPKTPSLKSSPKGLSPKSLSKGGSGKSTPGGRSRGSLRSGGFSAKSLGEVTGPFEDQIKLLLERITELEDHLSAMAELEQRLKELEEQNREMEGLRSKIKELTAEVNELRARECPVCPIPSETELKGLRSKVPDLEAMLEKKGRELQDLQDKLRQMTALNTELSQSVATLQTVQKKHSELEHLHAQVLEEKRRKSVEARDLTAKIGQLTADYQNAQNEIDKQKGLVKEWEEKMRRAEDERRSLEGTIRDLQRQLEENATQVENLKRKIKELEEKMEDLRTKNAELEGELRNAGRKLEEALQQKRRLEDDLQEVRKHCEQMQQELQRQLREQQKKCQEACDALSKRGQCILEHEKKCLNVTSQMEKDNQELQDKLKQMKEQLDAMADMERRTKTLQGGLEEYSKRALERGRELEQLKKLEETCELKKMQSEISVLPSPMFSLPDLPTPSRMDYTSSSLLGGGGGGSGGMECKVLTDKLKDLEREKTGLNEELEGKMRQVKDIKGQLEDMEGKGRRLKEEKEKACK